MYRSVVLNITLGPMSMPASKYDILGVLRAHKITGYMGWGDDILCAQTLSDINF